MSLAEPSAELEIPLSADVIGLVGAAAEHVKGVTLGDAGAHGRRAAVEELLAVAVDEAGERVSDRATALLRGEGTEAELRVALSAASALLDLLESVRAG